ncbi:MAG: ribonuclease Z [Bacteroidia bacterium]|nr:ribonuclease Z [Bacteroidia bacterium]
MLPFSVTILGSSSALPTSTRFPTSQVVSLNERLYLIDCGEGTQIQLRKFRIKTSKINHIFISHLHGDHIFGLPGLISTMALGGKKGELHIYSHSELKMMMDNLMKFMNEFDDFKVVYHPLNFRSRAVIYEDSKIVIDSFPLKHRIPCCGFIFKEKLHELHLRGDRIDYLNIPIRDRVAIKGGADYQTPEGAIIPNHELTFPADPVRSYAFCTDTVCRKQIIPIIENVDLLYHEATFSDELSDLALKTYHTTARQAARLAGEAAVKKLIIGHFSSRYKSVKPLVDEARVVFPNTFPANDGDRFDL